MQQRRLWIIALLLLLAAAWYYQQQAERRRREESAARLAAQADHQKRQALVEPLPGSQMLANYGKAELTVQDDLTSLGQAISNYALLVKGPAPLPLGANEEIAAALLGQKKVKLPFFAASDACFNPAGQLVDRWGTALYFHATDHTRLDIRSAGPDQKMWTADDVHRRYDGRFVRQEDLNAPSLFESMKDYR
jgi:hypothetical protein